jgi:cell division protein FtsW (lipid II flippase)
MPSVNDPQDGSDPHHDDGTGEPPVPVPAEVPGIVLAMTILLCVGGVLTIVNALAQSDSSSFVDTSLPSWSYVLYGLISIGLGLAIHRRQRWARVVVLVLCGIGVLLALIRLGGSGLAATVNALAWPLVYVLLLNTASARRWFALRAD